MCEVTHRSPAMFLQSYTPLRVPSAARKVYEKVVQMHKRPEKLAFGMITTSLNVITIFAD